MNKDQLGFNGNIFAEPFKDLEVKVKINSGFATIAQKHTLTALKVMVGNKDRTILKGDTVFVHSDACKQRWATQVFDVPGVGSCIMVPEASVVMTEGSRSYNYALNSSSSNSSL